MASRSVRIGAFLALLTLLVLSSVSLPAQQAPQVNPALFSEMRWRNIAHSAADGQKAAAGVAKRSRTPSISACNGGVWKPPTPAAAGSDLRRAADRIDWLGHGRAVGSNVVSSAAVKDCHVRIFHRRRVYKSTDAGTRGRISASAMASRSEDRRRSEERESSVRRGARPSMRPERRARRVPIDRRRSLQKVLFRTRTPAPGRGHPSNPDIVYATLGRSGRSVGKRARGRATAASSNRPTVYDVDTTDAGPAGPHRRRRARRRSEQSKRIVATVEGRGGRHGRLSVRRCRRDVDEDHERRAADEPRQRSPRRMNPKDPDTIIVTDVVSYKSTDGREDVGPVQGARGGDTEHLVERIDPASC